MIVSPLLMVILMYTYLIQMSIWSELKIHQQSALPSLIIDPATIPMIMIQLHSSAITVLQDVVPAIPRSIATMIVLVAAISLMITAVEIANTIWL